MSRRVYKKSWNEEEVQNYFLDQKSKHFDPLLTELFLKNFNRFVAIYNSNLDDKDE